MRIPQGSAWLPRSAALLLNWAGGAAGMAQAEGSQQLLHSNPGAVSGGAAPQNWGPVLGWCWRSVLPCGSLITINEFRAAQQKQASGSNAGFTLPK